MAQKLADETLAQIFALHFDVPDDVLNSSEPYSRFYEKHWASSSHVLVVCKRWMRVATPALYRIVILRSSAQARALHLALKANKGLGDFIRKVISLAPNLTDIVVNMIIYGDDSTKGLCKVLPKINPSTVGLTWVQEGYARSRPENANERNLRTTIEACLRSWSNLSRFFAPATYLEYGSKGQDRSLRDAIADARYLRELHLSTTSIFDIGRLHRLAERPSVKLLALYNTLDDRWGVKEDHVVKFIEQAQLSNPNLAAKLVYMNPRPPREVQEPEDVPPPPSTLNAASLYSSPVDIQKRVWSKILAIAMEKICHRVGDSESDFYWYSSDSEWEDPQSSLLLSRNARYMLVCKLFLHIVQQQACRNLRLDSPDKLLQFAGVTDRNPELARHVRTLSLTFPIRTQDEDCQSAFRTLLTRLSLNVFSCGYNLSPGQWAALGTSSGATLRTLSIDPSVFSRLADAPGPITLRVSMVTPFVCLTSLEWDCDVRVVFQTDVDDLSSALPSLSNLSIDKNADSLLSLLSQMRLPSLRSLVSGFEISSPGLRRFLNVHGAKVTRLRMKWEPIPDYLRLCPNITRLEIGHIHGGKPWLKGAHDKLKVIEFDQTEYVLAAYPWRVIFDNFDVSKFPALREFRVSIRFLKWPTEQRAVAKFAWTLWGEKLLDHNVKLVDRKAGEWRPRLQTATRGKRSTAIRSLYQFAPAL
ncbi:hypothetical protein AURDEDRAFT_159578 [Auricularia subglabra TFB-10046 SS5]|nr:hypothetical protein AURDEDRAFT_159578 [Auricularia subglabra TFB-10046 SS5]